MWGNIPNILENTIKNTIHCINNLIIVIKHDIQQVTEYILVQYTLQLTWP